MWKWWQGGKVPAGWKTGLVGRKRREKTVHDNSRNETNECNCPGHPYRDAKKQACFNAETPSHDVKCRSLCSQTRKTDVAPVSMGMVLCC